MGVLGTCPSCGMASAEWRCPRCNALKVVGCAGSCTVCGDKGGCDVPDAERPDPVPAGHVPADKDRPSGSCCG